MNTFVDVTMIKEAPMAIQNSMKFLWKILWASEVPNVLPLHMTLYYICRIDTWYATSGISPGNKVKHRFRFSFELFCSVSSMSRFRRGMRIERFLLNYSTLRPRCLKSIGKATGRNECVSPLFAMALGYS
jgi:hypothetical protein